MENIRGNRPNMEKNIHVDSPDFPQSFQMESPSVVRGLESASATGTWRHVTEMFSTFYGVLNVIF